MATLATTATIRRALLYVPASSSRFLQKSTSLTVDNVTYDLEDSVTPSRKVDARKELRMFLQQRHRDSLGQGKEDQARTRGDGGGGGRFGGEGDGGKRKRVGKGEGIAETAVRINSVDSGYALDDLTEVLKAPDIDALVIPKVNSAADLQFVADVIRHYAPSRFPSSPSSSSTSSPISNPTSTTSPAATDTAPPPPKPLKLLALIESAASLLSLPSITTTTPLLNGLIFAAEDFAADLSLTRTPPLTEMLYARSAIVTAARAARLPSAIDLVSTAYKGPEALGRLREEAEQGRRLGFNGKQVVHPSQVGVVEGVFGVSGEEGEWAVRVCVGDGKATAEGRGAWTLMPEGMMVDRPVVEKARAVVQRARACGVDLEPVWERWRAEEPG